MFISQSNGTPNPVEPNWVNPGDSFILLS